MAPTARIPLSSLLQSNGVHTSIILAIDPGETTGVCTLPIAVTPEGFPLGVKPLLYQLKPPPLSNALGQTEASPVMQALTIQRIIQIVQRKVLPSGEELELDGVALEEPPPVYMVMESYRIYGWKAKDHTWSSLYTPRLIGALEYVAAINGIPLFKQNAQTGKGFVTDQKLTEWGLYDLTIGKQHARDALRHALQFAIFHEEYRKNGT